MKSNPFFELYVGDRISSREFVTLFSPKLVPHMSALFRPGNIVVTGIQGAGKSMLLSLLKPHVRREYLQAGEEFPVPIELRKFICGSVNLAHSNVIDFGYRKGIDEDVLQTEFFFGDFLNYLLIDSLLSSIEIYASSNKELREEVGLLVNRDELDGVSKALADLPIFEGWLTNASTFQVLRARIAERIRIYRRYNHKKLRSLPTEVIETLTPIGGPIIDFAKRLKNQGIIDEDTNVMVDIDQYEELGNISSRETSGKAVDYRAVINKALASRTPHVSYRIGTRKYSWRRHGRIHGTQGKLESSRDYKYIDFDGLLRRHELDSARAKNVFHEFASDVFRRRLRFAEFNVLDEADVLKEVYGDSFSPKDKVNKVYGLRSPEKYINLDTRWSQNSKDVLRELATSGDLFSAKLGEIWLHQKGDVEELDVRKKDLPWERVSARWWKKERSQMISILVASAGRQKAIWGGVNEILELSGGSILAFLGINQFIWAAWLSRNDRPEITRRDLPNVAINVQSMAIYEASEEWVDMIFEQTGRSAERKRFVQKTAEILEKRLLADKKLSYPGATGFSVGNDDLLDVPDAAQFLEQLSDYGNMLMLPHTSRETSRRSRTKYYFHPIYCPSLGMPYVRTKEPYYVKIAEVAGWIHECGYPISFNQKPASQQDSLFD